MVAKSFNDGDVLHSRVTTTKTIITIQGRFTPAVGKSLNRFFIDENNRLGR